MLPLVIGRATRLAQFYTRSDKIYEAVIRFGWSTDTYDRAGTPTSPETEPTIDAVDLEDRLGEFLGEIQQVPPPVSAKKVAGVRAYKLARKKVEFELQPVPVHIYELALLDVAGPRATVRAHCSGGTYLRSIAHDLGQAMDARPPGRAAPHRVRRFQASTTSTRIGPVPMIVTFGFLPSCKIFALPISKVDSDFVRIGDS